MNSISAFAVAAPGLELSSLPADSNLDGLGVFRSILSGLSAGSSDDLRLSLPASLNAWLAPLPSDGNVLPSEATAKPESLPLPLQQLLGQLSAEDKAVLATWSAQDWQQWMMQQTKPANSAAELMIQSSPDQNVSMVEAAELQIKACAQPGSGSFEAQAAAMLSTATESEAMSGPKIAEAKTAMVPEVVIESKATAGSVKQAKRATTAETELLPDPLAWNALLPPALSLAQPLDSQPEPPLDRQFKQPWQSPVDLASSVATESESGQVRAVTDSPLPLPALNTPEVEASAHQLSAVSRLEPWPSMPSAVVKADEKMLAPPIDPKAAASDEQVPLLSRAAMEAESLPQASKQDAVSIEPNQASAKLSAQAQQLLQTLDAKVLAQAARLPAQVWQPVLQPQAADSLKTQAATADSPALPGPVAAAAPMLSLMTQWLSQRTGNSADNKVQSGLPSLPVTPDLAEPIKFAASSPVVSSAKFSLPTLTADSSEPVMEVTTSPLTETLMPPVVKPEPSSVVTKTEASQLSSLISTRDPEPMLDLRQPAWHEKLAGQMQSLKFMQLKEAEIRLDPPELGALKIQLSLQTDGGSQVSIQTAVPETRQLIEQSLPRLRELFQQQGLSLAQTNVSSGGQGQQSQQDSNSPAERHWSDSIAAEQPEETRPLSAAKLVRAGGVDHYA